MITENLGFDDGNIEFEITDRVPDTSIYITIFAGTKTSIHLTEHEFVKLCTKMLKFRDQLTNLNQQKDRIL
jgi:hypothetical protein